MSIDLPVPATTLILPLGQAGREGGAAGEAGGVTGLVQSGVVGL